MNKATFVKKMQKHEVSFKKLQERINYDVNKYAEKNPEETMYSMDAVEKFSDHMILVGAWIQDRMNGNPTHPNSEGYKKGITSKIRKVLGFTF